MQQYKIKKKVEQIEKIAKNEEQIPQSITDVMESFDTKSVLKDINVVKRSGVLASSIIKALLILPFIGVATVSSLFESGLNKDYKGEKDAYYDLKNNQKVNWRHLLIALAKRYKLLIYKDKVEVEATIARIRAFIVDDTFAEKTGKKIEGIGYVFDHVKQLHVLGFKILVLGFWDGISFIPLDFSIHREKRDSKAKQIEKRINKKKEQIKRLNSKKHEYRDTDAKKSLIHLR